MSLRYEENENIAEQNIGKTLIILQYLKDSFMTEQEIGCFDITMQYPIVVHMLYTT